MSAQKITILLWMFLDVLGLGVFIPAMADLKMFYGTSDLWISLSLTAYSLCAFFAAPLLWQISDKYGRKHVLLACILGTLWQFLILLVTQNFWIYLVARVINGITGWNFSILQAILTDISKDDAERKANYGLLGAVFGIGFIIWPLLGTFLLKRYGVEGIFVFGALFALVETFLIAFFLRETKPKDHELHLSFKPFKPFLVHFSHKKIGIILWILTTFVTAAFVYQSVISVYMSDLFGIPGYMVWYYLSAIGLVSAINQWFLLKAFWFKRFTHKQLIWFGNISYIVLLTCMMLVRTPDLLWVFVSAWILISLFIGPVMPVYNSEVIAHTDPKKIWEINGVLGSLHSVGMIIGPIVWWILLSLHISVFWWSIALACVMLVLNRKFLATTHVE